MSPLVEHAEDRVGTCLLGARRRVGQLTRREADLRIIRRFGRQTPHEGSPSLTDVITWSVATVDSARGRVYKYRPGARVAATTEHVESR